jgi:hypothetical protein
MFGKEVRILSSHSNRVGTMKFFRERSAACALVAGLVFLLGLGLIDPGTASAKAFRQIATGATEGDPGGGYEAVGGGGDCSLPPDDTAEPVASPVPSDFFFRLSDGCVVTFDIVYLDGKTPTVLIAIRDNPLPEVRN